MLLRSKITSSRDVAAVGIAEVILIMAHPHGGHCPCCYRRCAESKRLVRKYMVAAA